MGSGKKLDILVQKSAKERISNLRTTYYGYYFLYILSYYLGLFPVHIKYKDFWDPEKYPFKICSYSKLYAVIVNLIFYYLGLELFVTYAWYTVNASQGILLTDIFAIRTFVLMYFLIRQSIYIMVIFGTSETLKLLRTLKKYDVQFVHGASMGKLLYSKGFGLLLILWISQIGITGMAWRNFVDDALGGPNLLLSVQLFSRSLVLIGLGLTGATLDVAEIMFHCAVGVLTTGISNRIDMVRDELQGTIEAINEREKCSKDAAFFPNFREISVEQNGLLLESAKLSNLIRKFMGITDLSHKLNRLVGKTLFIFVAASVLELVSVTYFMLFSLSDSGNQKYKTVTGFFTSMEIVGISFITLSVLARLMDLINVGQRLEDSVSRIQMTSRRFTEVPRNPYLYSKLMNIQGLVCSSKICLKPFGLFKLNRSFLTAVFSTVVKFIIVLAQFRASDIGSSNRMYDHVHRVTQELSLVDP